MTEHWVWSNAVGAWRDKEGNGFTGFLHEAGRFHADVVGRFLEINALSKDDEYPLEVAVEVNNTFLTREAQRILAEYVETGDRTVIDRAYFAAQDRALVASLDFQTSLGQMLRGEGREVDLDAMIDRRGADERS